MALTEGDRAIIRKDAFIVCEEFNKVHVQTCPHGKLMGNLTSELKGFKKGFCLGLFLIGLITGLGGGFGIFKLMKLF